MDNYNSLQEEKEPDDVLRDNIIRRNKKKISQGSEIPGKSMLKKSDLSLVFLGAGIITLIIFFVFLRPTDKANDETAADPANPPIEETVKALEQKLTTLEEMLQAINANQSAEGEQKAQIPDIKPYVARIERVETALSVKFDVLTSRVDKLDDKLSSIIREVEKNKRSVNDIKQSASAAPPAQKAETPAPKPASSQEKAPPAEKKSLVKQSTKAPESAKHNVATKTSAKSEPASAKSTSKQQKAATGNTVYHTVAKGDTLYNISKRYNITVDQIRSMNKMSANDPITIGQKLMVKK